jgi:hypothetical protein
MKILIIPSSNGKNIAGKLLDFEFNTLITPQIKERLETFSLADVEETEEWKEKLIWALTDYYDKEKEHLESVEKLESILDTDGFYEENGSVYHESGKIAIPKNIASLIKDDITGKWEKFWRFLSNNPDQIVRETLYKFIEVNKLTILDSGLILAGRRILSRGDSELSKWANEMFLTRKKQKKGVKIPVYNNEGVYNLKEGKLVGILDELIHSITYTDNHTKTLDYKLGVENRMDRSKVNSNPNSSCGAGFHSAGPKFCTSGFGDTPCLITINPADVCCVPYSNDIMRSAAFTIVAILTKDLEHIDDLEIHAILKQETTDVQNEVEDVKTDLYVTPKPTLNNYSQTIKNILNASRG